MIQDIIIGLLSGLLIGFYLRSFNKKSSNDKLVTFDHARAVVNKIYRTKHGLPCSEDKLGLSKRLAKLCCMVTLVTEPKASEEDKLKYVTAYMKLAGFISQDCGNSAGTEMMLQAKKQYQELYFFEEVFNLNIGKAIKAHSEQLSEALTNIEKEYSNITNHSFRALEEFCTEEGLDIDKMCADFQKVSDGKMTESEINPETWK